MDSQKTAAIHAFFSRLRACVRISLPDHVDDYRYCLGDDESHVLTRIERWQNFRKIREKDNKDAENFLRQELEKLRIEFDEITDAYWLALADLPTIDLNGKKVDVILKTKDIFGQLIQWHKNDGGNWGCYANIESDEVANEIIDQLERSDSKYPLSQSLADRLSEAMQVSRSLMLRQVIRPETSNAKEGLGGEQGAAITGNYPKPTALQELKPSHRLAWLSFLYAAAKLERNPEGLGDRDAWKYLKENGIQGAGELDEYKPPMPDTYTDYLTIARRKLGEPKKRPTTARGGRSVVEQSET